MNDLRVSRTQYGTLVIEKDFETEDRVGIRIDVTFKPKGWWQKIMYYFFLDLPGPIAVEVESGGQIMYSDSNRVIKYTKVEESSYAVAQRGSGIVRAVLNPEDFYTRWKISIKVREIYN